MAFAVILFLFQLCQAASLSHIEPSADADDNPDILVISVASETWDASAQSLPSLLRGWTVVPRFQPSKLTNKHPQLRQYLEVHSSGRRQQHGHVVVVVIDVVDVDLIVLGQLRGLLVELLDFEALHGALTRVTRVGPTSDTTAMSVSDRASTCSFP